MTTTAIRREKNRLYNIAYRERHRAKVRAANSAWQAENLDYNSAKRGIHRAMRFGCETVKAKTPEFDRIKEMYREARSLTEQTGVVHHVDHIVPFSRGGAHHPDNMQILSAREHAAKTREERSVRNGAFAV